MIQVELREQKRRTAKHNGAPCDDNEREPVAAADLPQDNVGAVGHEVSPLDRSNSRYLGTTHGSSKTT